MHRGLKDEDLEETIIGEEYSEDDDCSGQEMMSSVRPEMHLPSRAKMEVCLLYLMLNWYAMFLIKGNPSQADGHR